MTSTRPPTTPARTRVVLDQIASLTDASAITRHAHLVPDRGEHRERLVP